MSLAHGITVLRYYGIKDTTERAYHRGNLTEKHQRLTQGWVNYFCAVSNNTYNACCLESRGPIYLFNPQLPKFYSRIQRSIYS